MAPKNNEDFEQLGLDRSIPHIGVIMEKFDTQAYPVFPLPPGFTFSYYRDGFEKQWAALQYEVRQTDTLQEAEEIFRSEFLQGNSHHWREQTVPSTTPLTIAQYPYFSELCKRMIFVLDCEGSLAATGAVWKGTVFGKELQRLHYIAVKPKYQGIGLSKALLTKLLELYHALGYKDYLYLTSQTWSYKALNIYSKFGFKPYLGEKPQNWTSVNLASGNLEPWDYQAKNTEAWEIINGKIAAYRQLSQKEKNN